MHFNALGFRFQVETDSDEVEQAVWSIFEPNRIDPDPAKASDVIVRLLADKVPEDPGWLPLQPMYRSQNGYTTIAASRQTILTIDANNGFAYAFLSPQVRQNHEFLRVNIVQAAIYSSVDIRMVAPIHAAIIAKNGRSLMLRGLPGAGKSTLAYACLVNGFSLVAEDASFVRETNGRFEICGMPWTLYLLPDATNFFPEVAEFPLINRFSGYKKYAIQVEDRFPGQTQEIADIGPVVFVVRSTDGKDRYRRLERDHSLRLLDETAIASVACDKNAERDNGIWEQYLEAGVYEFEIGPDPIRASKLLDELIER